MTLSTHLCLQHADRDAERRAVRVLQPKLALSSRRVVFNNFSSCSIRRNYVRLFIQVSTVADRPQQAVRHANGVVHKGGRSV